MGQDYQAVLIVAFGGPEKEEDVIEFLEIVTRGRNIPRERLLEVAKHYRHFGGVSPINDQVRQLIVALRAELDRHDIELPIYWGNRNWHPMLPDTVQHMADEGVTKALALVLAAYSSYSSCRQYLENIQDARSAVGPNAPEIDKIRVFYNHPDFVAAIAECVRNAFRQITAEREDSVYLVFTAHSIPKSMADACEYETQLTETCRLVAEELKIAADRWRLVYQSRSGRPTDPWLEPDICDHLRDLKQRGVEDVIVMPLGFLSDHLEILYDLDVEARSVCREITLNMVRATTVGTHPRFISMLRGLIQERVSHSTQRRSIGQCGPSHDVCPVDCCHAPHSPRPPTERHS